MINIEMVFFYCLIVCRMLIKQEEDMCAYPPLAFTSIYYILLYTLLFLSRSFLR